MKPNTVLATTEGSLGGRSVAMQIDANSIAHIMSVLTELYSDPALAVVREYSVNARDSHIEAGQTRPIEITTPNAMSRYFTVKDYGVGLSVDDLTEMYSKYGASTKRGTNTQTGMLGLGSKSALAYTNQFTIVAVKNGVKTTVSVRRIEDGTGVMEIVDTKSTTDPNGVEIVVPVRNMQDFDNRVKNFFRFWEPNTVLINGKAPESVTEKSTQILPHIWIRPVDYYAGEKDVIVMGNVPYPIDTRINSKYAMTAFLPIGAVNFTPSREELHLTDLTKAAIQTLKDELESAIKKVGRDAVESAPTKWEAIEAYLKFSRDYGINIDCTYKGAPMDARYKDIHTIYYPLKSRDHVKTNWQETPSPTQGRTVLAVTDFPYKVLSPDRKRKVRMWIQSQPDRMTQRFDTVVLFPGKSGFTEWLRPTRVIKWSDLDSQFQIAKTYAAKKTTAPAYNVMQATGGSKEESNLTGTILYFSPTEMKDAGRNYYDIAQHFPGITVVELNMNRWDKFKRDYPTAQRLVSYVKAEEKPVLAALTTDDIIKHLYPSKFSTLASKLDVSDLDDPDLVDVLTIKPKSATLAAWEKFNARKIATIGYSSNFPEGKADSRFGAIKKRYPMLFASIDSYNYTFNKAEVTAYLNAVYAIKENKA